MSIIKKSLFVLLLWSSILMINHIVHLVKIGADIYGSEIIQMSTLFGFLSLSCVLFYKVLESERQVIEQHNRRKR